MNWINLEQKNGVRAFVNMDHIMIVEPTKIKEAEKVTLGCRVTLRTGREILCKATFEQFVATISTVLNNVPPPPVVNNAVQAKETND